MGDQRKSYFHYRVQLFQYNPFCPFWVWSLEFSAQTEAELKIWCDAQNHRSNKPPFPSLAQIFKTSQFNSFWTHGFWAQLFFEISDQRTPVSMLGSIFQAKNILPILGLNSDFWVWIGDRSKIWCEKLLFQYFLQFFKQVDLAYVRSEIWVSRTKAGPDQKSDVIFFFKWPKNPPSQYNVRHLSIHYFKVDGTFKSPFWGRKYFFNWKRTITFPFEVPW